ncbi:unnamed protein product [Gordionus sp. m RMFG-2023]
MYQYKTKGSNKIAFILSLKDIIYKNKIWELLAKQYNMPGSSLWKNLRDCFIKEKQKLKSGSAWPFYQDMLFLVETLTPRSQKSSLDIEECTTKDANDIFNEITGGDLIDSENISDDIFIPKDSAALNLSNDSEKEQ